MSDEKLMPPPETVIEIFKKHRPKTMVEEGGTARKENAKKIKIYITPWNCRDCRFCVPSNVSIDGVCCAIKNFRPIVSPENGGHPDWCDVNEVRIHISKIEKNRDWKFKRQQFNDALDDFGCADFMFD